MDVCQFVEFVSLSLRACGLQLVEGGQRLEGYFLKTDLGIEAEG